MHVSDLINGQASNNLWYVQKYPTSSPQRCPKRLVFGTSAELTTTSAKGAIHVGILYVAIAKYGFFLYIRTDSIPTSRKNHTLAPITL